MHSRLKEKEKEKKKNRRRQEISQKKTAQETKGAEGRNQPKKQRTTEEPGKTGTKPHSQPQSKPVAKNKKREIIRRINQNGIKPRKEVNANRANWIDYLEN